MTDQNLPLRPASELRGRVRDVLPKLYLGKWQPGSKNSITDVPGVLAHTQSIHIPKSDIHDVVNTGITTILPRKDFFFNACYAGIFRFNGNGEMTGTHWINETGLLHMPIIITNTFAVGAAHQGVNEYGVKYFTNSEGEVNWFALPVVGETFDGYLNDVRKFAVQSEHIIKSIEGATSDAVKEGNTGGGTAMVCHQFKGGTGSSSRVIHGSKEEIYTVAALVQANYGRHETLRIGGVPVGRLLAEEEEVKETPGKKDGSIIVIIATDVPLHPLQLQRVATRATVGLARVGGNGNNGSGDIFLAFSTANKIPAQYDPDDNRPQTHHVEVLHDETIDAVFSAAADATEEAIYNALCSAETMTGRRGHTVEALPLARVQRIMEKYT